MIPFSVALSNCPLVAILRGLEPCDAIEIGHCLVEAGFLLIEVPLNSPNPFNSITKLANHFGERVIIGAGTVLTVDEVDDVANAGGQMIISPNTNVDIIMKTKTLKLVSMPGIATITEAFAALKVGADALKMFPAEGLSPSVLRAMRAVLPKNIPILPVGGIGQHNMTEYVSAGAQGFGIGSSLYHPRKKTVEVARAAYQIIEAWKACEPRALPC